MTCKSCGEKTKKCNKDFTKAVIEIDNPESINIFRKVVVPASMGDDTDVPAAIGKYRNVLLNYESNNHTYLYSSDGVPTLLTSDVAETIEQRVADLEVTLADEIKIREETDSDLQSQINTKADIDSLATVATTGDYADLDNKPTIGNAALTIQKNSTDIGTFTANSTTDATIDITVPTTPADIGAQAEITSGNKLSADLVDDTDTTNKFVTAADLSTISTALQPADIDKVVMTDIDVSGNTSTTTVSLEAAKENLMSGAQTTKSIALPVASTTEAGVMNSATFDAVTNSNNNINALLNGAVAITGLSASPSQSDITTAWQTETGLSTLINRASVYDVSNNKVWTYYTNDATWHAASNTAQVTINTFTNSSEGTIKGSTNVGQVFAENDGTGSVNGWDALNAQVSDNTNNIGSLQTSVAGKQDKLTAGSNITISSNTISATDTTYTAGTGLTLAGTEFSADTSVLQEKLTAGNAIDITSNVISADVYPADYFTADAMVTNTGSSITLNNTLPVKLANVDLLGNTTQQASPTPDYPQDINVVTGVQTVTIKGKNRMPLEMMDFDDNRVQNFAIDLPEGTNTISFDLDSFSMGTNNSFSIAMQLRGSDGGNVAIPVILTIEPSTTLGRKSYTFTSTGDASIAYNSNIRIQQADYANGARAVLSNIQIETGSDSTPFEPYQSQTYSIDLGAIELCKIGDYQDYIYKSGSDWYVHKDIGEYTFTGSENWGSSQYGTNSWNLSNVINFAFDTDKIQIISNIATGIAHADRNTAGNYVMYSGSNTSFTFRNTSFATLAEVQAATSGNYVYYSLATPTDTKITDSVLTGQLEELGESVAYIGVTNFSVAAASPDLPALLRPTAYRYSAAGVADALGAVPGQQMQANWTQADTAAVDYIKNKPADLVQDASYVHTDNNFTTTLKDKLDGIASGAEVNVQPNWTQTNTSADDYIKNKPTLAAVATSGSYSDLTNKPSLATVATSGSYNDLTNKPTIPAAQIQSDWTQSNTLAKDYIKNKPTVPVITMTDVDPGEGAPLADNQFIGVYQ